MADVAVDASVDGVHTVLILVVEVKQVRHTLRVIVLATPLCLLIRDHLTRRQYAR